MKTFLFLIALLLSYTSNAQIVLGSNPDDRFSNSFWTNAHNNPFRIFNSVNLYNGGTNRFVDEIMPLNVVMQSELDSTVNILTSPTNTPVIKSLTITNDSANAVLDIATSLEGYDPTIRFIIHDSVTWRIVSDGFGDLNYYPNAGGSVPSMRLRSDFVTEIGDLQLGNNASSGTITPTHTILIRDASGTIYKIPCTPQ